MTFSIVKIENGFLVSTEDGSTQHWPKYSWTFKTMNEVGAFIVGYTCDMFKIKPQETPGYK